MLQQRRTHACGCVCARPRTPRRLACQPLCHQSHCGRLLVPLLAGCTTNYARSPANASVCVLCNTTVAGGDNFVSSTGVCTKRRVCTGNTIGFQVVPGRTEDRICGGSPVVALANRSPPLSRSRHTRVLLQRASGDGATVAQTQPFVCSPGMPSAPGCSSRLDSQPLSNRRSRLPRPFAAPLCMVAVRLRLGFPADLLNLAEVALYDAEGDRIPRSLLRLDLSSTHPSYPSGPRPPATTACSARSAALSQATRTPTSQSASPASTAPSRGHSTTSSCATGRRATKSAVRA
mgnify:CR=1 FL=1